MVPTITPVQLAAVAQLMADPGRANILLTLIDGAALSAGELASLAGVTPQTMSSHLSKLVKSQLLAVEKRGRQHFYRLASPLVVSMLESMMLVVVPRPRQV